MPNSPEHPLPLLPPPTPPRRQSCLNAHFSPTIFKPLPVPCRAAEDQVGEALGFAEKSSARARDAEALVAVLETRTAASERAEAEATSSAVTGGAEVHTLKREIELLQDQLKAAHKRS